MEILLLLLLILMLICQLTLSNNHCVFCEAGDGRIELEVECFLLPTRPFFQLPILISAAFIFIFFIFLIFDAIRVKPFIFIIFISFILPNFTIVFLTPQRHFFIFQSLTFIQQLSSVRQPVSWLAMYFFELLNLSHMNLYSF